MAENLSVQMYKYLGSKITDDSYKNKHCRILLNRNNKCIRGRNGNMLVVFENGDKAVVCGRLLRKVQTESSTTADPIPQSSQIQPQL